MPSPDELLAAAAEADRLARKTSEQDAATLARHAAAHTAARLQRLASNEDLTWFHETFVDPLITAETAIVADLKRNAHEADLARHREAIAKEIRNLLGKTLAEHLAKAAAETP